MCFLSEGRAGFAVAEDDEWSPALELDGVGMMDLPNGQSSISTSAATVSEVRPHPRQCFKMQPVYTSTMKVFMYNYYILVLVSWHIK